MAYYPPNMGGYPQAYPGAQPGFPGAAGNYLQPGVYQGRNYPPGQGYPGSFPGQMGFGQVPHAQPMNGRQYNPGMTQYGQMNLRQNVPQGRPGLPAQSMGGQVVNQGAGGRTRTPGFAARMAAQQQGVPAAPFTTTGGRGLRLGKHSSVTGQMQPPLGMGMAGQLISPMGKPVKPKQFSLSSVGGGQQGSGIATINNANNFSLIANNLADPMEFQTNPQEPSRVYVAYLTNRKGQGSFSVGQLHPLGGGTYRVFFQSNVPFYDYDQVVVSLENPYAIGNSPLGPVVLASAAGAGISLPKPVRNFFGGAWGKVKGIGKGLGKKKVEAPDPAPITAPPSLLNSYTLGPPGLNTELVTDLPGLGVPMEDPQ